MIVNPYNNCCSCGTYNKCEHCNIKFICASSPFCTIHNNKSECSMSAEIKKIYETSQKNLDIASELSIEIVPTIINGIDGLYTKLNEINDEVCKISEKLKLYNTSAVLSSEESIQSNEIVPLSNIPKEDTVMVEKKGMFGKTKWVEKKK